MKFRHLIAACAIAVAAPSAYALPMGLGLMSQAPDLTIANLNTAFTDSDGTGAGLLTFTGDVVNLEQPSGTNSSGTFGTFGLQAILGTGSVFSSGNWSIQGNGTGPVETFVGKLTAFGLINNIFEFEGDITSIPMGGTPDANFPVGGTVGIILASNMRSSVGTDSQELVEADFDKNFPASPVGAGDLFLTSAPVTVPEPSTLFLGMLAIGLAFGRKMRRRLG